MSTMIELVKTTQSTATNTPSLRDNVKLAVNNYLSQLDGQKVSNVYDMVLSEIDYAIYRPKSIPGRSMPRFKPRYITQKT
jgi:DNA-binding protein Fis